MDGSSSLITLYAFGAVQQPLPPLIDGDENMARALAICNLKSPDSVHRDDGIENRPLDLKPRRYPPLGTAQFEFAARFL